MILAGDVGGTKTYLGLFEVQDGRTQIVHTAAFRTHDYPRLQDMLKVFVPSGTNIKCAAFGVPGPVVNGEVLLTNVSWTLTEDELRAALNVPVSLINDLVATGI